MFKLWAKPKVLEDENIFPFFLRLPFFAGLMVIFMYYIFVVDLNFGHQIWNNKGKKKSKNNPKGKICSGCQWYYYFVPRSMKRER